MHINERAVTANGFIFWLALSSVFCGSGAVLKTLYAEDLCWRKVSTNVDLRLQRSAVLTSVPTGPLDCQITLRPERHRSVVIAFRKYSLGPGDRIVFRDSHKFQLSLVGEGFFPDERKSILFEGPLTIHFVTNNTHGPNRLNFELVYTQVHDAPCDFDEFKCRNNKCIPKNLACGKHNHCGDNSDQENCGSRDDKIDDVLLYKKTLYSWSIAIIVVCVILGIVIIVWTSVLIRISVLRKKETKELPTVATASGVQQAAVPSISCRSGQSFHSGHPLTAPPLQTSASEHTPQNYEIPSIYPHLTSAPDSPGVDNPEFKSEE